MEAQRFLKHFNTKKNPSSVLTNPTYGFMHYRENRKVTEQKGGLLPVLSTYELPDRVITYELPYTGNDL